MKIIWYMVSWNIRRNRQKLLTFCANFLPFQPFDKLENQNFNIERNIWKYIILHIYTINENHMMYGSWDMECDRHFFVILDHFFPFYPPMDLENPYFQKNRKKYLKIYIYKKKLYGPFLWMGFNCLKATATSRRQFTFYH